MEGLESSRWYGSDFQMWIVVLLLQSESSLGPG